MAVHVRVNDIAALRRRVNETGSQAEVAARIGVSPPRLNQILNHQGELLTVDTAMRLEEALDVSPGTFFTVDTDVDLRPYLHLRQGAA